MHFNIIFHNYYGLWKIGEWEFFLTNGRFSFNQNSWFAFSATSNSEWKNIFKNFQKRGQPRGISQSFQKFLPETFLFI